MRVLCLLHTLHIALATDSRLDILVNILKRRWTDAHEMIREFAKQGKVDRAYEAALIRMEFSWLIDEFRLATGWPFDDIRGIIAEDEQMLEFLRDELRQVTSQDVLPSRHIGFCAL